ncbi:MAG TPA: DUF3592 domain-containing protein, partial [Thermoanaerobaculia bacterium]|nr:DUF3592 domain-containing protein [Thermoanaerobaculia bacterium]
AGRAFAGTSYVTGRELPDGEAVTVEYDPTHPERSRIEGMRRAEFSPFVAFVVIFPLIGYIVLTFCTFLGRRRTHLLQNGEFAMGVLTAKRATNMTVNKRPVMELTFEFKGRDGRVHEAKARSSTPAALEDEAQEPLLYDPEDPSTAYVLDEVPSRPQLGMNGELTGRPLAAALSLIIPTIVILANVLVVLGRMGK